jgi:hypothetical protein
MACRCIANAELEYCDEDLEDAVGTRTSERHVEVYVAYARSKIWVSSQSVLDTFIVQRGVSTDRDTGAQTVRVDAGAKGPVRPLRTSLKPSSSSANRPCWYLIIEFLTKAMLLVTA